MQRVLSFPQSSHFTEAQTSGEVVTKRLCFSCLFSMAFMALLAGFLLGRFVTHRHMEMRASACKAEVSHRSKSHTSAAEYLEKRIHRHHINDHYEALFDGHGEAGSRITNYQQAVKLRKHFADSGFTSVSSLTPSEILLTYHDQENPTVVELQTDMGLMMHRTVINLTERFHLPARSSVTAIKRTVQAPPMFVNFGSKQDYDFLESKNISVKNHILIMKMKKSAIFKQIGEAIKKGALGVLLFKDPSQHTDSEEKAVVRKLSPTLLGRLQLAFGDKTTEGKSIESNKSIMVDEISVEQIQDLLKAMSLNASLKSWTEFSNSTSRDFAAPDTKWRIKMISNVLNVNHTYYNVIAALKGLEEPDRYVLIGSNRESLRYSDNALGGTVAMMEIARVFGELNQGRGWVPRRTVVFCSWGLQGDGHFNAESWAQLLHPLLTERAVAYLSVEVAVKGNSTLKIQAAPLLETVIEEASALVPNPDPKEIEAHRFTLRDTINYMAKARNRSVIDIIHGEGDYQMFLFEQGIPSINFGFDGGDNFTDPTLSFHRAITELWAILIWNLADNPVLPLNPIGYSKFLDRSFFVVQKIYNALIEKHLDLFSRLHNAIISFNQTASDFRTKVQNIDKTNCFELRVANDQLVRLEKQMLCFPEMQNQGAHPLLTEGNLPSVGFGILQDLLEESFTWPDSDTIQKQIRQELSMLTECVQNGELLLKDVVTTLAQIQS